MKRYEGSGSSLGDLYVNINTTIEGDNIAATYSSLREKYCAISFITIML